MTEFYEPFGDPVTSPFWEGARRRELLLQRCRSCLNVQFYPRPFCLACNTLDPEWVVAEGRATVYAKTTVHMAVVNELDPPYDVGIVALDEGPRIVSGLIGGPAIGDAVRLIWHERGTLPPLPMFMAEDESD